MEACGSCTVPHKHSLQSAGRAPCPPSHHQNSRAGAPNRGRTAPGSAHPITYSYPSRALHVDKQRPGQPTIKVHERAHVTGEKGRQAARQAGKQLALLLGRQQATWSMAASACARTCAVAVWQCGSTSSCAVPVPAALLIGQQPAVRGVDGGACVHFGTVPHVGSDCPQLRHGMLRA